MVNVYYKDIHSNIYIYCYSINSADLKYIYIYIFSHLTAWLYGQKSDRGILSSWCGGNQSPFLFETSNKIAPHVTSEGQVSICTLWSKAWSRYAVEKAKSGT